MKKALCLILSLVVCLSLCACQKPAERPQAKYSALWVATAFGLDYSGANKTEREMKKALDNIVEDASYCHCEAIYFQVRGKGDAMYPSDLFPWSEWAGNCESYRFDPLAYLCKKAEANKISVYAWVNPYRLTLRENEKPAPVFPAEWVVKAGDGKCYLNPGLTECQNYVLAGVEEILQNYPVSGIVYDDYFYPSRVEFDDYDTYIATGVKKTREDWRRENTETLIRKTHELTARYQTELVVSPFGIWQNDTSDPRGSKTRGTESYSQMYADTFSWVKEGLVDVIAPQLYWRCGYEIADFEVLSRWWNDAVKGTDVKLYLTLAVYHLDEWPLSELATQLGLVAGLREVDGCTFYRYQNIADNLGGVKDYLHQ